ncbi:MAG: hypothetical protein LOD89_05335 [Tissierellales bacterium]
MKTLVSKENGYLEIENQANTRLELYYLLERINILEGIVKQGESAREELRELNLKLKDLCKKIVVEVENDE